MSIQLISQSSTYRQHSKPAETPAAYPYFLKLSLSSFLNGAKPENRDLRNVSRLAIPYLHLQFNSSTKVHDYCVASPESKTDTHTHLEILS